MDIGIGRAKYDPIVASQQVIPLENIATRFDKKIRCKQAGKVLNRSRAQGRQSRRLIADITAHPVDARRISRHSRK